MNNNIINNNNNKIANINKYGFVIIYLTILLITNI